MRFVDRFGYDERGDEGSPELTQLVRQQAVLIQAILAALNSVTQASEARGVALAELEGRASMLEAGVDAAYEELEEMRQVVSALIRRD